MDLFSVWSCQGIAESSLLHDPCLSEGLGKPRFHGNHTPTPQNEPVPHMYVKHPTQL